MKNGKCFSLRCLKSLLVLVSVPCLFLSGCQSGPEENSLSLENIRAGGVLTVLTNASFAPYEYYKDNEIVGVDISIANLIANRLGLKLEVKNMDFDNILMDLNNKKGHIAMAGISVTPEREKAFAHSLPYAVSSQRILVNSKIHPEFKDLDDLVGSRIGVALGTTSDLFISERVTQSPFSNSEEKTEIVHYKDQVQLNQALYNGDIDAVILDSKTAEIVSAAYDKLEVLPPVLGEEEYVFVYNKDISQELVRVVDEIITEIKSSGALDAFYEEHKFVLQQ